MEFGIHNSSWLDNPDPAEAFETAKAKAQWAEAHGFVWFSVAALVGADGTGMAHRLAWHAQTPATVGFAAPVRLLAGAGECFRDRAVVVAALP